jgi:hypothetical protein
MAIPFNLGQPAPGYGNFYQSLNGPAAAPGMVRTAPTPMNYTMPAPSPGPESYVPRPMPGPQMMPSNGPQNAAQMNTALGPSGLAQIQHALSNPGFAPPGTQATTPPWMTQYMQAHPASQIGPGGMGAWQAGLDAASPLGRWQAAHNPNYNPMGMSGGNVGMAPARPPLIGGGGGVPMSMRPGQQGGGMLGGYGGGVNPDVANTFNYEFRPGGLAPGMLGTAAPQQLGTPQAAATFRPPAANPVALPQQTQQNLGVANNLTAPSIYNIGGGAPRQTAFGNYGMRPGAMGYRPNF